MARFFAILALMVCLLLLTPVAAGAQGHLVFLSSTSMGMDGQLGDVRVPDGTGGVHVSVEINPSS